MTNDDAEKQLVLPALRGVMGDWVYYSALMSISDISKRVSYADEIHKNEKLSGMIQRRLTSSRSVEIAAYIHDQSERFFNSLVVATYDGEPSWHGVSGFQAPNAEIRADDLSEETLGSVGFLSLRGDEKLFAIDGQHRLAGIKKAIRKGLHQDPPDELSVIFVAHKRSAKGLERTRRLFTTLNKTAKPVSKADIIALDEDDVMAICTRQLIETSSRFSGTRIAFVATNNMPSNNYESLTTIGNLYDVLTIIFTKYPSKLKNNKKSLRNFRPPDDNLDKYYRYAERFFREMGKNFEELHEFFGANEHEVESVVRKHRGSHGGSALYRPIGIEIFVEIIGRLAADHGVPKAISIASKLPRRLDERPLSGLMWDPSTKTILNAHKVTLREVLCHMVGCSKYTEKTLGERYSKALGGDELSLPDVLV